MGKYVHQPGDNQYGTQAQQERHGAPAPVVQAPVFQGGGGGGGNGWVPTPHIPTPDVSLEPIASDEPVVAAGMPPLPDRLDLPVSGGWGRSDGGGSSYGGGGGGGGGGGASGGPPQPTGTHQHYNHYDPGAFIQEKGRGYYKANTAPMPVNNHDVYSAAGNGGNRGGGGGGSVEPRLNPANDRSAPAEAPAPITIKQATTQDLSLPDDEFSYKGAQKQGVGSKMLSKAGRTVARKLNMAGQMASQMGNQASMGMMMGGGGGSKKF